MSDRLRELSAESVAIRDARDRVSRRIATGTMDERLRELGVSPELIRAYASEAGAAAERYGSPPEAVWCNGFLIAVELLG